MEAEKRARMARLTGENEMSNEELMRLAEQCTRLIAESGASRTEALLVVLNMLNQHSRICMEAGEHQLFWGDVEQALQKSNLQFTIDEDQS
jgi:hypothetical protein